MSRVTLNAVNRLLPEGFELVRGNGYFYFCGGLNGAWDSHSVYTFHLSSYSVPEWLELFREWRTEVEG